MVRLRLRRVGAKGQPSYRIVATDSRSPRDGRFIEIVGFYNPRTDPPTTEVKEDRALYWLSVGAQPSEPVQRILKNRGTLERLKRLHQGESMDALIAELEAAGEAEAEAEEAEEEPEAEEAEGEPEAEEVEAEA